MEIDDLDANLFGSIGARKRKSTRTTEATTSAAAGAAATTAGINKSPSPFDTSSSKDSKDINLNDLDIMKLINEDSSSNKDPQPVKSSRNNNMSAGPKPPAKQDHIDEGS